MSNDIEDLEDEDWVESVDVDEDEGTVVVTMADTDADPVSYEDLYTIEYTANERLRELVEEWRKTAAQKPIAERGTYEICANELEAVLEGDDDV